MIIFTTNMTEETLKKIVRFCKARKIWQEVHRIFVTAYLKTKLMIFACNSSVIRSKQLKNIWNELELEINREGAIVLPELLLICKILGTLTEIHFSFRSSWMLIAKNDTTVDNLTNQLCACERALTQQDRNKLVRQEVLVANSSKQKKPSMFEKSTTDWICNYCHEKCHRVRNCPEWHADGRPKPSKSNAEKTKGNSVLISINQCFYADESDHGLLIMVPQVTSLTVQTFSKLLRSLLLSIKSQQLIVIRLRL
ncbi:hypothetical protein JTB14_019474 [Gonioctena quinquepunctata]|nr:hypothetical protein JTB14_019474 [Gonioctena quinquepunctata]